jgi:hypothetical protein
VPVISVTMIPGGLWGEKGIEVRPRETGENWERPAIVRFEGFGLDEPVTVTCGVRVHGATSRMQSAKHSFRLKFRKRYGPGKLRMAVFGEEQGRFDELLLRNPAHDSWTIEQRTRRENARYVNEKWCRETMGLLERYLEVGRFIDYFLVQSYAVNADWA